MADGRTNPDRPLPEPDVPTGLDVPTVDPSEDPTNVAYYSSRLQVPPWIHAGFPDYASYAANLRQKEDLARQLQERAINAPAHAAGVSASITQGGENARFALSNELAQARYAADQAHNAALLALQQGNAAEARRQFDISSQELARSHRVEEGIRQQGQQLASAKFGHDVYSQLANLASNPRNYMENFFRNRGQQPPANVAQYGNTSVTGPGLATFEQFLPNFLRATGLAAGAAAPSPTGGPASTTGPSAAAPTEPADRGGNMAQDIARTYSGQADRAAEYARQIGNNPVAGAIPGSGGAFTTGATANGAFNPQAGTRVENPFGAENSGQQYNPAERQAQNIDFEKQVAAQRGVKYMAGGGTLRMTAPHAIVNLLSGKVAAIAGEQPGRGPMGFKPESAKFSGQAYTAGQETGSDWVPPETKEPVVPPAPGDPGFIGPLAPYQDPNFIGPVMPKDYTPPTPPSPPTEPIGSPDLIFGPTYTGPGSSTGVSGPGLPGWIADNPPTTPAYVNEPRDVVPMMPPPNIPAPIQMTPAPAAGPLGGISTEPITGGPVLPTVGAPVPAAPTPAGPTGITPITTPPVTTGPSAAPPVINPTGSNPWGGPVSTPNVPSFLSDFMKTPSGLGRNPQFLPETQDPITNQMIQAGTFAPFLQRIFAQQQGLAGLGTNVPQQTNLPAGVPLVSSLALSQMSPSELAAFQSFVSSHGMDWNDYVALVKQASPEGGASNPNPAIPKFLQQ